MRYYTVPKPILRKLAFAAGVEAPVKGFRGYLSYLDKTFGRPSLLGGALNVASFLFLYPEIMSALRNMGLSSAGQFAHPLKDTNTTYRFLEQGPGYVHPLSNPKTLNRILRR